MVASTHKLEFTGISLEKEILLKVLTTKGCQMKMKKIGEMFMDLSNKSKQPMMTNSVVNSELKTKTSFMKAKLDPMESNRVSITRM